MGCSWSLYFAQMAASHAVGSVPRLKGTLFSDRSEGPVFDRSEAIAHYVCVNSVGIMGCCRSSVTDLLGKFGPSLTPWAFGRMRSKRLLSQPRFLGSNLMEPGDAVKSPRAILEG